MEQSGPIQLAVSLDKWQQRETDPRQNQTHCDQLAFTKLLHEPSDHATLNDRADQTAEDKEIDNCRRGLGFIAHNTQMKVVVDQEGQCNFEAAEAKRREKENADQQTDPRLRKSVTPLSD